MTRPIEEVLRDVWNAALDANNSPDFRDADGELDEDAYLRYQENVLRRAAAEIRRSRCDPDSADALAEMDVEARFGLRPQETP